MFEHLDDPTPPQPDDDTRRAVHARMEAAHRRRLLATGAGIALTVALLGSGLAIYRATQGRTVVRVASQNEKATSPTVETSTTMPTTTAPSSPAPPAPSTTTGKPSPPVIPAGWQTVTYKSVSFSIPPDWKVFTDPNNMCPQPYSAAYVGMPSGQSCPGYPSDPTRPPVYSMALQPASQPSMSGSKPVVINGNQALINDNNQSVSVFFPKFDLGVWIVYWTNHQLASQILNTMRVGGTGPG
jgi:hypothetical protein